MTLSSLLLKLHPHAVSILGVTFHPHRQTERCEGQILAWQQTHRDLQFALLKIPSLIGVSNMLLLARKAAP